MQDIRAYQNIKLMVDCCEGEWHTYNEPQQLYSALHVIEQLQKIRNPILLQSAYDYIARFIPLHSLVQRYK